MTNCLCNDRYGSAVWTSGITSDFAYRNNVVANCHYVWTSQGGGSALADAGGRGGRQGAPAPTPAPIHYKVTGSSFAQNRRLAGTGTGARLEYQDIDPSFLDLAGTTISDQPTIVERDQTKRSHLHPVVGSEAGKIGAGLFTR